MILVHLTHHLLHSGLKLTVFRFGKRQVVGMIPALFLLTACGDGDHAVPDIIKEQARAGAVQVLSEQCVSKLPNNNKLISEEKIQQVCDCTADNLVDNLSAQDIPDILAGKISAELTAKISDAALSCTKKSLMEKAASDSNH